MFFELPLQLYSTSICEVFTSYYDFSIFANDRKNMNWVTLQHHYKPWLVYTAFRMRKEAYQSDSASCLKPLGRDGEQAIDTGGLQAEPGACWNF